MTSLKSRTRTLIARGALAAAGVLTAVQLVPYGHRHSNPPVVMEPPWNTPETRALAARACFDCHSNEVRWPWYASVAPVSWMLQRHVDEGRRAVNFSEWNLPYEEATEAAETLLEGKMPLRGYLLLHPAAHLTSAEKTALAQGLDVTLGRSVSGRHGDDD